MEQHQQQHQPPQQQQQQQRASSGSKGCDDSSGNESDVTQPSPNAEKRMRARNAHRSMQFGKGGCGGSSDGDREVAAGGGHVRRERKGGAAAAAVGRSEKEGGGCAAAGQCRGACNDGEFELLQGMRVADEAARQKGGRGGGRGEGAREKSDQRQQQQLQQQQPQPNHAPGPQSSLAAPFPAGPAAAIFGPAATSTTTLPAHAATVITTTALPAHVQVAAGPAVGAGASHENAVTTPKPSVNGTTPGMHRQASKVVQKQ